MSYLLLDTALAGDYTIHVFKKEYGTNISLFKNTGDEQLDDVAPFFFDIGNTAVNATAEKYQHLNLDGYILAESKASFIDLFMHFQKFLYRNVNGKEYFFRFYDPVVMQKYFAEAEKNQLKLFFAPLESVFIKQPGSNVLTKYRMEKDLLQVEQEKISETAKEKISHPHTENNEIRQFQRIP